MTPDGAGCRPAAAAMTPDGAGCGPVAATAADGALGAVTSAATATIGGPVGAAGTGSGAPLLGAAVCGGAGSASRCRCATALRDVDVAGS